MRYGVPQHPESRSNPDSSTAAKRPLQAWGGGRALRAGLALLGLLCGLVFASSATAATGSVGLGTAAEFSVLAGSTVTNTGPTTMSGSLGLSPGSSVTGAPLVLGGIHVDDAVAIGAKNDLTTAYNEAAARPSDGSAGTDLSGQTFTPGVRTASSSLLLSSGSVTLNAEGNPDAVFVFQIGSTLTTGSNTSVVLENGAQACNVFWEVGSSATLGTGTHFVGTIMASASITADTAATINGRLLAQTGAVSLDSNVITTSSCASSSGGSGSETALPGEPGGSKTTTSPATSGSKTTTSSPRRSKHAGHRAANRKRKAARRRKAAHRRKAARRKAARRKAARRKAARRRAARRRAAHRRAARRRARKHSQARKALPHRHGAFTG